jgi:hypothetical protein
MLGCNDEDHPNAVLFDKTLQQRVKVPIAREKDEGIPVVSAVRS